MVKGPYGPENHRFLIWGFWKMGVTRKVVHVVWSLHELLLKPMADLCWRLGIQHFFRNRYDWEHDENLLELG